jgi:hypothetical protein
MTRLDTIELFQLKKKLGPGGFLRRFPHPFLVIVGSEADQGLGFTTGVTHLDSLSPDAPDILEVVPVLKAVGNPYPDQISVGRARNCDVVLRDSSVSKLHAHFRRRGARLELIDRASRNGTFVNGNRLEHDQAADVAVGDMLQFGTVETQFVDAAELLRRL